MSLDKTELIEQIKAKLNDASELLNGLQEHDQTVVQPQEIEHRVIHLNDNPFQKHLQKQREHNARLIEENERLKARLEILESGNDADVTRRIDDAVASSHENECLRRKLHEAEKRESKIITAFRKTSREFREVCYLLTGYRIDGLKDGKFRLSNMYANSADDVLYFEAGPNGTIQLLQNDYSERLGEYIETYLEKFDSFPAFLASLTLEQFKASTQIQYPNNRSE